MLLTSSLVAAILYVLHRRRAQAADARDPGGPDALAIEPRLGETDPEHHFRRARFHRNWALGLLLGLAFLYAVPLGSYNGLRVLGRVVDAKPVNTWTYQTEHKRKRRPSQWKTHYVLQASATDAAGAPLSVRDDVSPKLYRAVRAGAVTQVPFMVVPRFGLAQVGTRPALDDEQGPLALLFVSGLLWAYLATRFKGTGDGTGD